MKTWLARAFLLSMLLGLSACNSPEAPCAGLIGGGAFCLQATSAVAPFELQQKVDARFRGRHETLIVHIENDRDGFQFVGLSPLGQKIFHVSFDNREAHALLLPDRRISPSLLIATLQIALWPADRVRAGLEAPLILEESAGQRRIVNSGETTLMIEYTGDATPYRHLRLTIPAVDLELAIETLSANGKEP